MTTTNAPSKYFIFVILSNRIIVTAIQLKIVGKNKENSSSMKLPLINTNYYYSVVRFLIISTSIEYRHNGCCCYSWWWGFSLFASILALWADDCQIADVVIYLVMGLMFELFPNRHDAIVINVKVTRFNVHYSLGSA